MKLNMSPAMAKVHLNKDVFLYLNKVSFVKSLIYYMINSKSRTQINLLQWLKKNLSLSPSLLEDIAYIKTYDTNKAKIRAILKYVHNNLRYVSDNIVWKVSEYWQTPSETESLKTGDCEDGALLIYAIAVECGIPDYQLYIVAGEVQGGGHCYCVYVSEEDGLEYPIDWCYWYNKSYSMKDNYFERIEYYDGTKEWFRFNKSGTYKLFT